MLASVTALVAGCTIAPVRDYCEITQKPFKWQSDKEIDDTPIRPLRYIETDAEIYNRVCK